ncbi:hypothetical protein [Oceanobacter sp. 3_MG-2023]|uniref:hypothetical protein n=1 Tax=Oceanobacter sp. 3_MG-2023 TaxID=3062622 RepID=UPI002732B04B|nr:hypothetical protein [Oceanobacter sp. 3_MG-2023]MDP2505421.1 hypothetical protein [Oceanobacter sp. 3_MG-2023]
MSNQFDFITAADLAKGEAVERERATSFAVMAREYLKTEREQNALLDARKDALWQQLISVRGFVASDKMACTYQTLGQYRTAVLELLIIDEESKHNCKCSQLRTALSEAIRLIKDGGIITADDIEQLEIVMKEVGSD